MRGGLLRPGVSGRLARPHESIWREIGRHPNRVERRREKKESGPAAVRTPLARRVDKLRPPQLYRTLVCELLVAGNWRY